MREEEQRYKEFECNKCKQKPEEFILLLCDHVICGLCFNMVNSIKGEYGFDGVRCTCGVVTYFNAEKFDKVQHQNENLYHQQNEGEESYIDKFENQYGGSRNIHHQQKETRNQPHRHSVGLIRSKQTASTKNMSRLCSESFCNEARLIEDRLMLQRSNYPVEGDFSGEFQNSKILLKKQKDRKRTNENRLVKEKNIVHSENIEIDEDSLIDEIVEKENVEPNQRKTHKKHSKNYLHQQIFEESNSEEEPEIQMSKIRKGSILSEELKSEILFLKVQHKKLLETLNRTYNRALTKINDDYVRLESNLKDLCLEKVLLQNNDSHVDIGKIVQLRYDGYIASNLLKLIEDIKKFNLPDSHSIRGLSNIIERQIDMPKYETIKNERRDGINRFSSPQVFRKSHLLTEPVSIYGPKTHKYFGSSPKEIPPWIQNNSDILNPSFAMRNSNHYAQNGHKLHKKSVRNRTNVIIQL